MNEHDFELDLAKPTTILPSPKITSAPDTDANLDNILVSNLTADQIPPYKANISTSQEATRAKIAWTFTQLFLLIVICALILPTVLKIGFPQVINDPVETTKTLVTLVASVLAGPFGFIVGFYFKQDREN